MPVVKTYPGVYIEEVPSGVRTIVGVSTSVTAFIGQTLRGQVDLPVRVQSFGEFERKFGGLWVQSPLSYAVSQYFLNGGMDAIIVRVVHKTANEGETSATVAAKATLQLPGSTENLVLEASSEGAWGSELAARIDYNTSEAETDDAKRKLFNLTIRDMATGTEEVFRNLSLEGDNKRFIKPILEQESDLVRLSESAPIPAAIPIKSKEPSQKGSDPFNDDEYYTSATDGRNGASPEIAEVLGSESAKTGLYALEKADIFNLLCIPPLKWDEDLDLSIYESALAYCKKRRAMLIVDPPAGWTDSGRASEKSNDLATLIDENAAVFFPRVKMADPLRENRLKEFVPCAAVAGVIAKIDSKRGIWKAPAGLEAGLAGVRELTVKLTDGENGVLNPLGINCLRTFSGAGNVVWGSRTLRGADRLASEWKYLPVRRLALYIEESLYRGTQWVVFEPNDSPLWAQIRMNLGAFMHNLFRQGAFQGSTPREAYFVKCDGETTTQNDIDQGIVNILVGFAPLKPAEFVVIKIQQIAKQMPSGG
jgi:uncharacterized protein